MNRKIFALAALLITFAFSNLYSQSISGKIIDASNSDPLVGAIVKVEGTTHGAAADLDGKYEITGLDAGTYSLVFSYIGYESKTIAGVNVTPGQSTRLDVALKIEGIITEEITVEGTTSLANEQTMLMEQKNSNKVQDGISEQQIKRAPDAAASEVLKRVMGVNIVNDKFVQVRGTSDRYNLTTLNGIQIPSSEPDKKAFAFDLFPANLLENIIVNKTFTPDQPGNFTGGLVQVNTKDFPDALILSYSMTASLNTETTGKDFRTYNAGQRQILFFNSGIDDGGRSLPFDIPSQRMTNSFFNSQQLKTFGRSFRNNWGQNFIKAPLNGGFQLSLGNRVDLLDNPLGILISYSYRNSFTNTRLERNQYNTDFTPMEEFKGDYSEYSVLGGGIANLNYKIGDYSKLSSKTTYTVNSEDITSYLDGFRQLSSEENDFRLYETRFRERTLFSTQLTGEHYIHGLGQMHLSWKGAYTESKRHEPDVKTIIYQRERGAEDLPYIARLSSIANSEGGGRFFSDLLDINRVGGLDINIPFIQISRNPQSKLKAGVQANTTSRSFDARSFAPKNLGSYTIALQGLDSIFRAENIDTNKIVYEELTRETDKYRASDENYAGYLMIDLPIDRFRIVAGTRFEYNRQQLSTYGRLGEPIQADLKDNDFLPSLNLIYTINDLSNLRFSASQTVSRPELREIAPFGYLDFLSGVNVYGNPELKSSLNQNIDLRYEIFPNAGEIISLSGFYKHFNSPIEEVYVPGANNPQKTFENATNGALNYGVELEVRKKLGFISEKLEDFSLNGNLTLIDSKVNIEGLQSGETENTRRLQGQSPYTLNLGLFYDNYKSGTSVNVLYNRFGRRVSEVGRNGYNNIEELGNDIIDFTASQRFFTNFELKFSAKDILNPDKLFVQKIKEKETEVRKYKSGTNYSLTLSYKF